MRMQLILKSGTYQMDRVPHFRSPGQERDKEGRPVGGKDQRPADLPARTSGDTVHRCQPGVRRKCIQTGS